MTRKNIDSQQQRYLIHVVNTDEQDIYYTIQYTVYNVVNDGMAACQKRRHEISATL